MYFSSLCAREEQDNWIHLADVNSRVTSRISRARWEYRLIEFEIDFFSAIKMNLIRYLAIF